MKVYTVIWHYIANHGVRYFEATSSMHAARKLLDEYSNPEFAEKATILAIEGTHVMTPAKNYIGSVG